MEARLPDKPQLLIVGGPNGSGKTTVAMQYATSEGIPYIGADAIAASLAPDDPTSVRVDAGRQFIRSVNDSIANKRSCVVESTLSGRSFHNHLLAASKNGYEVTIVFVFVDSVDVCVARVAERVRKGGHEVPEVDIRRRYVRSIRNFWTLYRDFADSWVMLYNGGSQIQDVAVGSRREMAVRDATLQANFLTLVESFDD